MGAELLERNFYKNKMSEEAKEIKNRRAMAREIIPKWSWDQGNRTKLLHTTLYL